MERRAGGRRIGERFGRRHGITPSPFGGWVRNPGGIKEIFVIKEHYVGKAFAQAILFAAILESFIGAWVVDRRVKVPIGADLFAQIEQHTLAGIADKVLVVQLVDIGRRATGYQCLQLGEVIIIRRSLDLDRNLRVDFIKVGDHGIEVSQVIGCGWYISSRR